MIERINILNQYQWTAQRFEILSQTININTIKPIVLEFVCPAVQGIRHDKRFAERWYWSWKTESQSNLFCRLYFLAERNNHTKIWEEIENIRKNKFNNLIKKGTSEPVWTDLSDDILEWGITLEHVSEMSLMVWKGVSPGSGDRYGKTFHHFFEPLLISDKKALQILQHSIGQIV